MQVKMLRSVGSAKGVHQPGHVVELEQDIAEAWIKAGLAEKITRSKAKPAHETKVMDTEEKETVSRSTRKKTNEDE
ncbi:hypothetical protein [Bacillus sp. FJAT-52991]|uniref:Uncharacterized protein n=1 Tax=Bacillus kandeliae TaxID=3129297 RepID=A0ABZ2N2C4_9BACI